MSRFSRYGIGSRVATYGPPGPGGSPLSPYVSCRVPQLPAGAGANLFPFYSPLDIDWYYSQIEARGGTARADATVPRNAAGDPGAPELPDDESSLTPVTVTNDAEWTAVETNSNQVVTVAAGATISLMEPSGTNVVIKFAGATPVPDLFFRDGASRILVYSVSGNGRLGYCGGNIEAHTVEDITVDGMALGWNTLNPQTVCNWQGTGGNKRRIAYMNCPIGSLAASVNANPFQVLGTNDMWILNCRGQGARASGAANNDWGARFGNSTTDGSQRIAVIDSQLWSNWKPGLRTDQELSGFGFCNTPGVIAWLYNRQLRQPINQTNVTPAATGGNIFCFSGDSVQSASEGAHIYADEQGFAGTIGICPNAFSGTPPNFVYGRFDTIRWFAPNSGVVSDAQLAAKEGTLVNGEDFTYDRAVGGGNSYHYSPTPEPNFDAIVSERSGAIADDDPKAWP